MPQKENQITAVVSENTKIQFDRYTRETGIKKGRIVEDALLYYLRSLREIPSDLYIPETVTLSEASGKEFIETLLESKSNPKPNEALKKLFS